MNRNEVWRNGVVGTVVAVVALGFSAMPSHAVTITNGGTVVFTSPTDPSLGASGETVVFQGASTLIASNPAGFVFGHPINLDSATAATIIAKSSLQHEYSSGVTGSGTLILTAAGFSPSYRFDGLNTWTGTMRVEGGISLRTFSSGFFGDSGNTIVIDPVAGGATVLTVNNESGYVNPRNITLASGTAAFNIQTAAGLTNSGVISGPGVLRVGSFGDLTLTGNNTYSGGTLLPGYTGKLVVSTNSNLGTAGIVLTGGTPTIRINGAAPGSFYQGISVYNYNLRFEVADASASVTWGGALGDYGHTTAVIYKNGPGRLNLTNNSVSASYGGYMNFVVSNGVLGINYTNGLVGNVTVKSGGALGGIGKLSLGAGKSVTIENGGALAPGNSAGTLTITNGPLVLNNTSQLNFELGPHDGTGLGYLGLGSNDLVSVGGNLTLDGELNVSPLPGLIPLSLSQTNIYRLFDYTGTLNNLGLAIGTKPTELEMYIDTSIPNQVNLFFYIPEPSTIMLLALGGLGLLARRRTNRGV